MKIQYRVHNSVTISRFLPVKAGVFQSECKKFELLLTTTKDSKLGTVLSPKLIWRESTRPEVGFSVDHLELELTDLPEGNGFSLFQHGYQSWSISRKVESSDTDRSPLLSFLHYSQENVYSKNEAKVGKFISEYLTLLYNKESQNGVLYAPLEAGEFGTKFEVVFGNEGNVTSVKVIYDVHCLPDLRPNAKLNISKIKVLFFKGSPETKLLKYFEELGKKEGPANLPKKVPTGWCSWYYYYTNIDQKTILDNLTKVRELNLPFEFFQIDDGYQKEIGDWLIPNEKFPGGMRILADEIKRVGLKPGIWLAPFLVRKKSEFFRKYPEAILKDQNGKPVPALYNPLWGRGYTYALDITHPTALAYIEKVFTTLVKEWGYPYLKLDFLYAGLLPGDVYNKTLSPQARYQNALELIRKIVGKNTFLLGCGAPMLPSIGFFDGMRISCDVAPFWNPEKIRILLKDRNALCTKKALINDITRSSMHRHLWLNDPDCLLVRKKKNKMNEAQTKLMASVMAVSGGMLLVSDDLTKLEMDRLDLLKKAFQLNRECQAYTPIPIGIFENEFPLALYNPGGYLGIWNPTEEEKIVKFTLPPGVKTKAPFLDFWTGTRVDLHPVDGGFETTLPAFGSVVVSV
ncbi:alpha-galactosidase [Leptospira biflexa]|uniref:glycoside hydrolase family 36 protein n=1 Tax=Leptospira biflexa TaxID=172 RepID=UPI0010841F65|nr:glycoside hydrolase family 36 protein [Leptospira biflexa]TGM38169.1 alpha-galactosidase [Leptospira biflexa]TGM41500.1 alpha-galactosidase [Leptospira biflexa]TGM47702.1 alpha-galactosidase [Leptospira biflexa]TGM49832.1 alpha-galactosidase [Leptospira biflexa]TGM55093.1 alpha-galactosidase [Leptospira biflexa]